MSQSSLPAGQAPASKIGAAEGSRGLGALKPLLFVACLCAVAAFPFIVTSPYYLHLLTTIAIFSIVTLGLDIVFGYTGEVSIGHSALFGIGAYTAGIVIFQMPDISTSLAFWISLPLGMIVAAAFGALLALPALRVTGPYLAMVTLAFGTIIQILINEMTFLTNGPLGIKLFPPVLLDLRFLSDWIPLFDLSTKRMKEVGFYFIVVGLLLVTLLVINRILASHYGRAFEALRDSPIASDCMGVSVYKHKVLAFVIRRRFRGACGRDFRLFRTVHRAEQLQFRAVDPVSAGCDDGRGENRGWGRSSAPPSSSSCRTCWPISGFSGSSPASSRASRWSLASFPSSGAPKTEPAC